MKIIKTEFSADYLIMKIFFHKLKTVVLVLLLLYEGSGLIARPVSAEDIAFPVNNEVAQAESFKEDFKEIVNDALVQTENNFSRPKLVKVLSGTKKIVLTFDDGPHPGTTPMILEILKKRNLKAIFFVLGIQVEKYPELVEQIYRDGHEIGNHSYNHKNLTQLTESEIIDQIDRTSELVKHITGVAPKYLRPPYGATNAKVLSLTKRRNMSIVLWTVDPKDWQNKNPHKIMQNIAHQLGLGRKQRGGLLLLHDIYPSTAKALDHILDQLALNEYKIVAMRQIDSETHNFWAATSPELLKTSKFKRQFEPAVTGHDLLVKMFTIRQKYPPTAMSMLKANRNGELLVLLQNNSFK